MSVNTHIHSDLPSISCETDWHWSKHMPKTR